MPKELDKGTVGQWDSSTGDTYSNQRNKEYVAKLFTNMLICAGAAVSAKRRLLEQQNPQECNQEQLKQQVYQQRTQKCQQNLNRIKNLNFSNRQNFKQGDSGGFNNNNNYNNLNFQPNGNFQNSPNFRGGCNGSINNSSNYNNYRSNQTNTFTNSNSNNNFGNNNYNSNNFGNSCFGNSNFNNNMNNNNINYNNMNSNNYNYLSNGNKNININCVQGTQQMTTFLNQRKDGKKNSHKSVPKYNDAQAKNQKPKDPNDVRYTSEWRTGQALFYKQYFVKKGADPNAIKIPKLPETNDAADMKLMWKEYHEKMKPIQNREFVNARRSILRLEKLPYESLNEKQRFRLSNAKEAVEWHKKHKTIGNPTARMPKREFEKQEKQEAKE